MIVIFVEITIIYMGAEIGRQDSLRDYCSMNVGVRVPSRVLIT